jgi:hypothetical protein
MDDCRATSPQNRSGICSLTNWTIPAQNALDVNEMLLKVLLGLSYHPAIVTCKKASRLRWPAGYDCQQQKHLQNVDQDASIDEAAGKPCAKAT